VDLVDLVATDNRTAANLDPALDELVDFPKVRRAEDSRLARDIVQRVLDRLDAG